MTERDYEMYSKVCKDQFEEGKKERNEIRKDLAELTSIVTNGLKDSVTRIELDLKKYIADRNEEDAARRSMRTKWAIAIASIFFPLMAGGIGWLIVQMWTHMVTQ
jgi:hypothetical protein